MPLRERALNSTMRVALRQIRLPFDQPSPVDQATQKPREKWSDAEIEALVEFVLFHSAGDMQLANPQARWFLEEFL